MDIIKLLELMKERKSVRAFDSERDIPPLVLIKILEAARLAPSAGNVQTWHFFIVKDEEKKKKIAQSAYNQDFIYQAQVVVVVAIDKERALSIYGKRGIELYSIQDTAASIEHMLLAARAQGVGSCWIGAFNEKDLEQTLCINQKKYRTVAIIPLGFPVEDPPGKGRLSLKEIVTEL